MGEKRVRLVRIGQVSQPWVFPLLVIVITVGCVLLVDLFLWFQHRVTGIGGVVLLACVGLYVSVQFAGSWIIYLASACRAPRIPPPAPALSVDVFVTVYHEPYTMVERTLAASCAMHGAHRTWLLDDGDDPAFAALARRLGAFYLTRTDHRNAKAGNINAALARTCGDIIVIFDADHVPAPQFLTQTLGFFADPACGFVQIMLTFDNGRQSRIARAAAESALDFYNPTSCGQDWLGGVTLVGSNALIRRTALASIGGYRPGLAEDLATSVALHAAGWRSVYVPEPLAPGLAPSDFHAWFVQQMKWARGVFEVLIAQFPRSVPHLTWGQRLAYAVRMTYYWIGSVIGSHLVATIAVLIGPVAWSSAFEQYLLHVIPIAALVLLIRWLALAMTTPAGAPPRKQSAAIALIYVTWPVHMLAWLMAIARVPLVFRPTPKTRAAVNPFWLTPHAISLLALGSATAYRLVSHVPLPPVVLAAAFAQFAIPVCLCWLWSSAVRHPKRARVHADHPHVLAVNPSSPTEHV